MPQTLLERVRSTFTKRQSARSASWEQLVSDVASGKLTDPDAIADSLDSLGRDAAELDSAVEVVTALDAAIAGLAGWAKREAAREKLQAASSKAKAELAAVQERHKRELADADGAARKASAALDDCDYRMREDRADWTDITARYRPDGSRISVAEHQASLAAAQAQRERDSQASRHASAAILERRAGLYRELAGVQSASWQAPVIDQRTGITHGSADDWRPARIAEIQAQIAETDRELAALSAD